MRRGTLKTHRVPAARTARLPDYFGRIVGSPTARAAGGGITSIFPVSGDRELTSTNCTPLSETGFGRDVAAALERRKQALAKLGHATDLGNGWFRAPKDLIERGDVERTGQALAAERGRTWQPAVAGNHVTGKLVGSAQRAVRHDRRWNGVLSGVAMPGGGVGRSQGAVDWGCEGKESLVAWRQAGQTRVIPSYVDGPDWQASFFGRAAWRHAAICPAFR